MIFGTAIWCSLALTEMVFAKYPDLANYFELLAKDSLFKEAT